VLRVLVARWIRLPAPGGSREGFMETCVMLFNFTDQGIPNVKDITMQVDPVRNLAKSLNVTLDGNKASVEQQGSPNGSLASQIFAFSYHHILGEAIKPSNSFVTIALSFAPRD
jgi:hypothetical protein